MSSCLGGNCFPGISLRLLVVFCFGGKYTCGHASLPGFAGCCFSRGYPCAAVIFLSHYIGWATKKQAFCTDSALDPAAFETAVSTILGADTVYIMGLRSNEPLAAFLHFYLNMIRGKVVLLNSTSVTETFEQMIRIGDKDCFIGISFPRYSMRTLKAMEFANDRNAKVIAITDSIHSPMNLYSSCNLLARSDMVSIVDSLVAPLSVINALVVALCIKRPKEVKKNLEMLEETWNNYQVYLNDEINFIDDEPMLNYSLRKEGKRK